jgi:hypothetical protein
MSDEDKEVFEKLDKEFELNRKIENSFEEFHLLKQWKRLNGYLQKNLNLIKQEMKSISIDPALGTLKQESVVMFYENINFHVYNFLNTAFSFREALYLVDSTRLNWPSHDKFIPRVNQFKSSYPHRVVNQLRSRIKTGLQLDSTLSYEVRTIHHPSGEGVTIGFDLESSDWEKIKSELDSESKKIFEKEKNNNYLLEIFDLFVRESDQALKDIEQIFNDVFKNEIFKVANLKKELQEIEDYFNKKGFSRI